jgi:hypothetical protein
MKKKLTIAQKMSEKTPKAIKKLQLRATFIGGTLSLASTILAASPQVPLPYWVPMLLAFATGVNHLYLQTFTAQDNE